MLVLGTVQRYKFLTPPVRLAFYKGMFSQYKNQY